MSLKSLVRNPKGMSLVEVMVILVVMSLIGLGTTSLLKNMITQQARGNTKAALATFRDNLKNIINNGTAWTNTVNLAVNAADLRCLVEDNNSATDCPNLPAPTPVAVGAGAGRGNFAVAAVDGSVFYNALAATAGISQIGAVCNAFNAGAGNDACPFRYNLDVWFDCPGATATCPKPQVTIRAELQINAASKGLVRFNLNPTDYNFTIRRGERVRYEPFEIIHSQTTNAGGGSCPDGGNTRPARALTNEVSDAGNNVTLNAGARTFTVVPGTYECTVTAQGYNHPEGFRVIWRRTNPAPSDLFTIGSGFTPINSSTVVTGKVRFEVNANTTFQLIHQCTNPNSGQGAFNLGIPSPPYTNPGNSFTRVFCVRSS